MTANDKNGTLDSNSYISSDNGNSNGFTNYLDRLVLQAMAEITLKSNVPYVDRLPDSIGKGLYELVGGYGLLRYLAKNYSDGMPDGVSYNKAKTVLTLSTDFTDSTLDLANLASTVKTVNASALKSGVKILGNSSANLIDGGAGADTLNGGKGNDTLTSGAGKDVFVYSGGKDVITDYAAGDKIKISGTISKSTLSGSNAVFTIGSGTLTVKNGKGKSIVFTDAKGKSRTIIGGAQLITNSSSKSVTLGASVAVGDAAARTTAVKITGNTSANSITGGTKNDSLVGNAGNDSLVGNAGNDSLNGGKGNDTLTGGAGNDTFIYTSGDGNDVISGFESGDLLQITDAFTTSYNSSKKSVVFKVGSGSVTLRDFGSTTTFHVNDTTYKLSGGSLTEK